MAAKVYPKFILAALKGDVDLDTATVKASAHTSAYTPAVDTHEFFSDLTNEVTGTGYTAGGVTVGSLAATYVSADDAVMIDAADIAWGPGATISGIRTIVFYISTGVAGTSRLISYATFASDQAVTSGTFTGQLHASGIARFPV